jgi:hypothetical protein
VWAITGGISLSMSSDLTGACPNDVCPEDRADDLDKARTLAHVATAGLVVGAVGATVGIVALAASLTSGDAPAADAPGGQATTGTSLPTIDLRVGLGAAQLLGRF